MDFIPNHSSDLHPWFQKSLQNEAPYSDYYVWADPKGYDENGRPIPPSNWVSIFRSMNDSRVSDIIGFLLEGSKLVICLAKNEHR